MVPVAEHEVEQVDGVGQGERRLGVGEADLLCEPLDLAPQRDGFRLFRQRLFDQAAADEVVEEFEYGTGPSLAYDAACASSMRAWRRRRRMTLDCCGCG